MATIAENIQTIANDIDSIKTNLGLPSTSPLANVVTKSGQVIEPTGTISITGNGIVDVTQYAIANVNVSGGGGGPVEKGVFFIDYDGSIVEAWDLSSVASKTELPSNPTHTGLVAQGWNWDLSSIKSYVSKYPETNIYVGQMYKTLSGLTEIDVSMTKATGKTITMKMVGNKDWGDGTQDNLTTHTYTDYGDYTITCDGTSFPAGSASSAGMFETTNVNVNRYWCTAIRVGENVTSIGNYALYNCYSLVNITMPDSITSIGNYALGNCKSLVNITMPDSITSIESRAFIYSYSLTNIMLPDSITSIGSYAFYNCYSLTKITIPDAVTSIGSYAFYNCYSLTKITIPDAVTSIGNNALYNCYSLVNITMPDSITSIESRAFYNCYSIIKYNFTSAVNIPSLENISAFTEINKICKIVVPDALYDDWIVATNWSTYADYIYKASEV